MGPTITVSRTQKRNSRPWPGQGTRAAGEKFGRLTRSGCLGLRNAKALMGTVIHQRVCLGGFTEDRIPPQVRAAFWDASVDVVAEHDDLLAGPTTLDELRQMDTA